MSRVWGFRERISGLLAELDLLAITNREAAINGLFNLVLDAYYILAGCAASTDHVSCAERITAFHKARLLALLAAGPAGRTAVTIATWPLHDALRALELDLAAPYNPMTGAFTTEYVFKAYQRLLRDLCDVELHGLSDCYAVNFGNKKDEKWTRGKEWLVNSPQANVLCAQTIFAAELRLLTLLGGVALLTTEDALKEVHNLTKSEAFTIDLPGAVDVKCPVPKYAAQLAPGGVLVLRHASGAVLTCVVTTALCTQLSFFGGLTLDPAVVDNVRRLAAVSGAQVPTIDQCNSMISVAKLSFSMAAAFEAVERGDATTDQQRIVDAVKAGSKRGAETISAAFEAGERGDATTDQQRIVDAVLAGAARGGEAGRETISAAFDAFQRGEASEEQQRIVDAMTAGGKRGNETIAAAFDAFQRGEASEEQHRRRRAGRPSARSRDDLGRVRSWGAGRRDHRPAAHRRRRAGRRRARRRGGSRDDLGRVRRLPAGRGERGAAAHRRRRAGRPSERSRDDLGRSRRRCEG
jgi:hypothetical protein